MRQSSATDPAATSEAERDAGGQAPLGARFAEALGRKDFATALGLLDPLVDFRGLTPGRVWEASDVDGVGAILRQWFDDNDVLEEIVSIDSDSVSDRQRVAYRFSGHNADGPFVVEQQAYYTDRSGRIDYMRVLCSGFRPS